MDLHVYSMINIQPNIYGGISLTYHIHDISRYPNRTQQR